MTELTQKYLKSILKYNRGNGFFTCKKHRGSRARMGTIAGTTDSQGYRLITINWKIYHAHRLAYLYVNGEWPSHEIDHINRKKDDNRWVNLRECTHAQNTRNSEKSKNNTSGYKGVCWNKRAKKWQAAICFKGKVKGLGHYNNKQDAAKAYNDKAKELFGEFAYLNKVEEK